MAKNSGSGLPCGVKISNAPLIQGVDEKAPMGEVKDVEKQTREDIAGAKKQKSKRKF